MLQPISNLKLSKYLQIPFFWVIKVTNATMYRLNNCFSYHKTLTCSLTSTRPSESRLVRTHNLKRGIIRFSGPQLGFHRVLSLGNKIAFTTVVSISNFLEARTIFPPCDPTPWSALVPTCTCYLGYICPTGGAAVLIWS